MPPVPRKRTTTCAVRQISSAREPRVACVSVTHQEATLTEACHSASRCGKLNWLTVYGESCVDWSLDTGSIPVGSTKYTHVQVLDLQGWRRVFLRFTPKSPTLPAVFCFTIGGTGVYKHHFWAFKAHLILCDTGSSGICVYPCIFSKKIGEIGEIGDFNTLIIAYDTLVLLPW